MAKAAFNKKKTLFTSKLDLNFEEETSKILHLEHGFGQQIRNTWKVLKCGAGEGWRSVGPIT